MKKVSYSILAIVAVLAIFLGYRGTREREVVILSTNDIHGTIKNFARYAQAVKECRDTATVVVVDAGDRWTGNAYVDLAPYRLPIINLMNKLGCDVVTLGNHEFDEMMPTLDTSVVHSNYPVLCSNMNAPDSRFFQDKTYTLKTDNGIKIFFVGVVTDSDNGHPDGYDDLFEGITFDTPVECAHRLSSEGKRADLRVLLSHAGREEDFDFASKYGGEYDVIIGGHTHDIVDTLINGTVVGQTGKYLQNVGVTKVKFRGSKIKSIDYQNIPLSGYEEDPEFVAEYRRYTEDPELNRPAGTLKHTLNFDGVTNLVLSSIKKKTNSDIAFYHKGGIRIETLSKNPTVAEVAAVDPFRSRMVAMEMTPKQLRNMIITKFNDTLNLKEAHRIDLFSTVPYSIVVDRTDTLSKSTAMDVIFPTLREDCHYNVVISDYPAKKYRGIESFKREDIKIYVVDAIFENLHNNPNLDVENNINQSIIVK